MIKSAAFGAKHVVFIAFFSVVSAVLVYLFMGASTSNTMSQPYIVKATAKHTASVIFLHGLGDTGAGWSQSFSAIRQPHIKYIFPNAFQDQPFLEDIMMDEESDYGATAFASCWNRDRQPYQVMPVTLSSGFRMPSWFDIKGLDPSSEEDEAGIKKAGDLLQQFIQDEEKKGVPRSRIIVGGFSQGGALALYSSLMIPQEPVAGIVALSSWLPLHRYFPEALKSNQATPIHQAHGKDDFTVPYAFGLMTSKLLKQTNPNCEFRSYPNMAHSSCEQEMDDVSTFIKSILPTS